MARKVLLMSFFLMYIMYITNPHMACAYDLLPAQAFGVLELYRPGMDFDVLSEDIRGRIQGVSMQPKNFSTVEEGVISTFAATDPGVDPELTIVRIDADILGYQLFVSGPLSVSDKTVKGSVREVLLIIHFDSINDRDSWYERCLMDYLDIYTVARKDMMAPGDNHPFFMRRMRSSGGLFRSVRLNKDDYGRPAVAFFLRRPCGC